MTSRAVYSDGLKTLTTGYVGTDNTVTNHTVSYGEYGDERNRSKDKIQLSVRDFDSKNRCKESGAMFF